MGKKAKANKQRRKYTKYEFMTLCCDKCTLCDPDTDPSFCYGKIYIKDPKKFIKTVFKDLLEFEHALGTASYLMSNRNSDTMLKMLFQETFCDSKICRDFSGSIECPETEQCFHEFLGQITYRKKVTDTDKPASKRKKNRRQVYEPYPTFFCNTKFEQSIKEILNSKNSEGIDDGNVDIEQDKAEERSDECNTGVDQSADGSKSQVSGSAGGG